MMAQQRRASDQTRIAHITEWAKLYAIIWIPLVWLVSQLGFSLLTPRLTVQQVKSAFDSTNKMQEDEIAVMRGNVLGIYEVHSAMADELNALRKFDCLSKEISTREKFLAGLRCDEEQAKPLPLPHMAIPAPSTSKPK